MCPLDSPGQSNAAEERSSRSFAQNIIDRLFEFSPDAILVTDADGVMRAANPRAEELFGYNSQELFGKHVENACARAFPRRASAPSRKLQRPSPHQANGRGDESLRPAQGRLGIPCRHHAQAHADRSRSGGGELYSRCHRAARRAGGGAAERPAPALDLGQRRRVRHLSARPRRPRPHLEPRRRTHQGLYGR